MTFADLSGLPSVSFAPQSAGETETAIITAYEAIAKATLQPGDPVRLFLESLAYVISVQNGLIDLAGKQNLLAYARGGHLDHLGAPMGVIRIQPQPARTTVRFGVDEALAFDVPVPAGTRVTTQSGGVMFATLSDAVLPAGELFVETSAKATEAGASGNGLLPGQICRLVDRALERVFCLLPLTFVQRVRVQLVFELHRVCAEADRQVALVQNRLCLLLFCTVGLDLDRVKEVVARDRRQCV